MQYTFFYEPWEGIIRGLVHLQHYRAWVLAPHDTTEPIECAIYATVQWVGESPGRLAQVNLYLDVSSM